MAIKKYPVRLISPAAGDAEGVFVHDEAVDRPDQKTLTLQFLNAEIVARASDYFEALCQIRDTLEKDGWRPVCYGSSRNVYPSGMGRDMGRGLKAYRLELGRTAKISDLVAIFDSGPDVQLSSVEEQKQFWKCWLRSRGIEPRDNPL
jgi:hypothetical protein